MKNILVILFLITISLTAKASDYFGFDDSVESLTISHNVFTYHLFSRTFNDNGMERDWNENNNVTGLRINTSDNFGVGVAYGQNSYYEDMFILEADFKAHTSNKYISYGASLMLASGYDERFEKLNQTGGLMPAVYTYAQLNYKNFHIKAGTLNFMAIAVMIEYDINLK